MRNNAGISSRGLGADLLRHRKAAGLTLEQVGAGLGTSASTISRLENGKREPTVEEVSAILALSGVVGMERERLLAMANGRSGGGSGLVEYSNPTTQSRTYLYFETQATVITNYELMLVPGLAQTADYAFAVVSAIQVDEVDEDIGARVGRRMARQQILLRRNPPRLNLVISEEALRRPVGGPKVMARQLRHLVDLANRPKVSIRVVPAAIPAHAGLLGQFVLLEFAKDPTVVFTEARTTGLFRDDPAEVDLYKMTLEKLTEIALDEAGSVELMRSIATHFDGG